MKEQGVKNKIKGFFRGEQTTEEVDTEDDAYYSVTKEEYHEENGIAGSKMMLLEPRAYSESQQIADYLKRRSAVVVNLKRVTPDQAKRIVDFLYGTIYAIGGDIQKLGGGIFLCTPKNVNVEGSISDDNQANTKQGPRNKKEQEENKEEDDFF